MIWIIFMGPFKCYVSNEDGCMDHYEGEQSNVVSVTRGCVGVKFA